MLSTHTTLVFRRPTYNYLNIENLTKDELYNRCVDDDYFLTALYISSYGFFIELMRSKNTGKVDSKIRSTLYNYYSRSATRATPFGMMSGVFAGDFTLHDILADSKRLCKIKLDRAIIKKIELFLLSFEDVLTSIGLSVNNTLVDYNGTYQYYKNIGTGFTVDSIEIDEFISEIVNKGSKKFTVNELFDSLKLNEDSRLELIDFIRILLKEEILVSDFSIGLGKNSTREMIELIRKFHSTSDKLNPLLKIFKSVEELESQNVTWRELDQIRNSIKSFIEIKDNESVFHVDLHFENSFANGKFKEIDFQKIVEVHSGLIRQGFNRRIYLLKQQLKHAVANTPIKLIDLFNPITGIQYLSNDVFAGDRFDPPTNKMKKSPSTISKSNVSDKILNKIIKNSKEKTINFQISELHEEQNIPLPPTMSCLFSIIKEDEVEKIVVKSLGGPSATNLIGRFGLDSEAIKTVMRDIIEHEDRVYSNRVKLISLSHANNKIVENIAQRPHLRRKELAFHSNWTANDCENRIHLDNLYVVYDEYSDRIVLYDRSENIEVLPRWDCAYNHSRNEIPLIQFLSDLQSQEGTPDLTYRWPEMFDALDFHPRIEIENIILSKATWRIKLKDEEKDSVESILQAFNKVLPALPQYFFLVNKDNKIFIDISNSLSHESILKYCKKNKTIIITEAIEVTNSYFKNEEGGLLNVEIVATLFNTSTSLLGFNVAEMEKTKQIKSEGRIEWIQINLFTNSHVSNNLILFFYQSFILNYRKCISKWFFIRYNDPSYHLRVRISFYEDSKANSVLQLLELLNTLIDDLSILRYTIEPYNREVSRYGKNTIFTSESIFQISSERTVKLLQLEQSSSDFSSKQRLLEAMTFLRLLEHGINSENIFNQMMNSAIEYLSAEFNISKNDIILIDQNYRVIHRDEDFRKVFDKQYEDTDNLLNELMSIVNQSTNINEISWVLNSLYHMHCNRLFPSNARYYELLVLHFYKKMKVSSKYY